MEDQDVQPTIGGNCLMYDKSFRFLPQKNDNGGDDWAWDGATSGYKQAAADGAGDE